MKTNHRSTKKRHYESSARTEDKEVKRAKMTADIEPVSFVTAASSTPSPGQLTAIQIKEMMANAQKMIEERKRALNALRAHETPPVRSVSFRAEEMMPLNMSCIGFSPTSVIPSFIQRGDPDKAKKIANLQAQIQSKLSATGRVLVQDKPAPLILNKEGRTVDVSGKEVQLSHPTPTLKANIRAKKREEFRQQLAEHVVDNLSEAKFFDPRIGAKPSVRNKRALRFHEPGKFQQLANSMRMKAQLDKLQNEISQIAKKTGISSATKLALIAPKTETTEDDVPNVEWWDSVILNDNYVEKDGVFNLKESAISNLVEHPTQLRPPTEPMKPAYMPVFLTKKERKKLRRQNRREAWKEEQEKIRLGLEPPPEPKLRISNLMRVLGTEAVQDPTKVEAHVREQMVKRQKAHEEANAARRLTAEQKRDKKVRKIAEDTTLGVYVTVYRISDLSNAAKKYKVETNAKQLFMTGCVVLFKDCNVVVVEGGAKQQKKYKRLMLSRIKWEEDTVKNREGQEVPNKCVLIWEGTIKERNFGEMKFKVCPTEKLAREHFKKHSVEHYWDLAYSEAVLGASEDV
ncbi:U4/U6 small nuclear ribonucleoprotein Prp3 isoform X2 [Bacillus rossius redtenbacheri]